MGISYSVSSKQQQVEFRDGEVHDSELESDDEMDSNYTTDAVGKERNDLAVTKYISSEDLAMIDNELNLEEKISLVFLLYDDAKVALEHQTLLKLGSQKNVVTEWVKSSRFKPNWIDELLESLTIIQNYALLRKLGYNKIDMNNRFLPRHLDGALFVNPVKKLLYLFCENLDMKSTKEFISNIQSDYKQKYGNQFEEHDCLYLELVLLTLINDKYISFENLTPIAKVIKKLGWDHFYDSLRKYCTNEANISICKMDTETISQPEKPYKKEIKPNNYCIDENTGTSDVNSIISGSSRRLSDYQNIGISDSSIISESTASGSLERSPCVLDKRLSLRTNSYNISPDKPGICLIINQETFYTECNEELHHLLPSEEKLENRLGTEKDKEILEKTFRKFGFTVYIEKDKTHEEILSAVKRAVQKVKDDSSLFVCILSHGIEGKIYGVNSIPVEVRQIKEIMCKTNLKNMSTKPKVLILQACQGRKCQEVISVDTENNENDSLTFDGPTEAIAYADMLTFWASVPGFGAVRDKKNGTWFIQTLCQTIEEYSGECHFDEVCTFVKKDVLTKRWGSKVMVPQLESTLSKFLFLPPMKRN